MTLIKDISLRGLRGLSYDWSTVQAYRDAGKLLCMRMDLSYKCNLQCRYCYTNDLVVESSSEASYSEVLSVVEQGIDLGMQSVVILGGEPLLHPNIFDLLSMLNKRNIIPVVFTNGLLMTPQIARFLYEMNASVLLKFDSLGYSQDILCGTGYAECRQNAFNFLLQAGFGDSSNGMHRLGLASVVTSVNYTEITDIWRYCRSNGYFPHIERMTLKNESMRYLMISHEQSRALIHELQIIDSEEYGLKWNTPYPPIPGFSCSIFYVGCHVDPYLGIGLCPEIKAIYNAKEKTLIEIFSSEVFAKARRIDENIKGGCSQCKYLRQTGCYGCRSKVFQKTGSLFEEDSDCPYIASQV